MFYEVFNIKISEISLLKVLQKEKKTTIKKKPTKLHQFSHWQNQEDTLQSTGFPI